MTVTNSIEDLVSDAVAVGTPLRIAGRSHWSDAGRPTKATRIASLAAHAGIVDYVPGDLTITVKSGTTLREIEQATSANGQWFPLDPFGSSDGTIGATIATGSYGPLAHSFGLVRDLVLGIEFVTGDARLVRGGGRVVKNVAGFDLVRLVTGSWGTIGVITEATLRLYSHPPRPVTVSMTVPEGGAALAQRIASLMEAPVTPLAIELVDAHIATRAGLPAKPAFLIEIGGNEASVMAQLVSLSRLGGMTELNHGVWQSLRDIEDSIPGERPIVMRLSGLPGSVAGIWSALAAAVAGIDGAALHATPSLGVVRCVLPQDTPLDAVAGITGAATGVTVIFERLPSVMWSALSPTIVSDGLSQRIMRAFDPHRILNPGILGPVT